MNQIDRSLLATPSAGGTMSTARKPLSEHEKLVQNTQKWVADTFYGTMLKEMRKSPWRSEELEGGHGGEAFEEMFDQRIADHMSRSAGSTLVNSIVSRIEAKRHAQSAKTVRDARAAYAQATRRLDRPDDHDPYRSKPLHAGSIPWSRARESQSQTETSQAAAHSAMPAQTLSRRRLDRILPEIYHVAPTD